VWKKVFRRKRRINHPVAYQCAKEIVEKWGPHLPEPVINFNEIYEYDVQTFRGPKSLDSSKMCGKVRENKCIKKHC